MTSSGASRGAGDQPPPDTPRTADEKLLAEQSPELDRPTTTDSESSRPDRVKTAPSPSSGERTSRKERSDRRSAGEDTLLSAPAPAASFEVEVDDRLNTLERDTDDLKQHLAKLESRLDGARKPTLSAQSWLFWVVFMLALMLGYQLLFRGR
jgi:hypothetical protein